MSKHTSAPWEISGQLIVGPPESLPNPKVKPRGKVIAAVYWDYCGDRGATEPRTKWEEANANLHLMKAAPELLEALQAIYRHFDQCRAAWEADGSPLDTKDHGLAVFLNCRAGDLGRAAIAQAEGGEA